MGGQHQGDHHYSKPESLPNKLETRKGICSEGTKNGICPSTKQTDGEAIPKKGIKADYAYPSPALAVIFQRNGFRDRAGSLKMTLLCLKEAAISQRIG